MTSKPTRPVPDPQAPPPSPPDEGIQRASEGIQRISEGEATTAGFGYLGAIFLGPVVPLIVYLIVSRRSPFARQHAATAVNLSISCLLYGLCAAILGGLLALDSITVALVIGLSLIFLIWLTMLWYLIRGLIAANRGEQNKVPSWLCAPIVS